MFEVALANVKTLKDMVKILVMATNIDVKDIPNVTYYQTDNFEIEFLSPIETSWCLDGEEYKSDNNKFTFTVEQSMKMLVPRENIDKLFDE